jgi:ABC-type transport system involved in multi-copper enzyme maturation permease subunit
METTRKIFIVAAHELRTLGREYTFLLLLAIFLAMTFFSVYIGWSTKATIFAIYRESVSVLQKSGAFAIPPNPALNVSALAIFDNMIVYIFLIGALLAIVIGHRSFVRERKSGAIPLILVRPIGRRIYIFGKIIGIAAALAIIIFTTFLIGALSTRLISGLNPSISEITKLFSFYVLSFFYLLTFAMLGLLFAILAKTESLALLAPVIIWVALSFVIPELTTGQNPVALLNPVNIAQTPPAQGAFFALTRNVLTPFSISQNFTSVALYFLEDQKQADPQSLLSILGINFQLLVSLVGYLTVFIVASILAAAKYSITSDKIS